MIIIITVIVITLVLFIAIIIIIMITIIVIIGILLLRGTGCKSVCGTSMARGEPPVCKIYQPTYHYSLYVYK